MIATIADYSFLKMHVFFLNRDERIHFQKDSFWHLLSRQWKLSCFFAKKPKPIIYRTLGQSLILRLISKAVTKAAVIIFDDYGES